MPLKAEHEQTLRDVVALGFTALCLDVPVEVVSACRIRWSGDRLPSGNLARCSAGGLPALLAAGLAAPFAQHRRRDRGPGDRGGRCRVGRAAAGTRAGRDARSATRSRARRPSQRPPPCAYRAGLHGHRRGNDTRDRRVCAAVDGRGRKAARMSEYSLPAIALKRAGSEDIAAIEALRAEAGWDTGVATLHAMLATHSLIL